MTDRAGRSVPHLRIVAIADSDSYVKWAAAFLTALPGADVELLVLTTAVTVSDTQLSAALHAQGLAPERVRRVTLADLDDALDEDPPDAVLLASRGPAVRLLAQRLTARDPRPVLVTGLPGMGLPARRAALEYRAQCDLFVLHSRREMRVFAGRAEELGIPTRFALRRLPFLEATSPTGPGGDDMVFAAQSLVPHEHGERRALVRLLARAARAHPDRRVVLKVRSAPGEHETHRDPHPYRELLAREQDLPENLVVSSEPMARALDRAAGLVTVSSTAAWEALARGIPVIALDSFGVSDRLLNTVFDGSGLLAGDEAVVARAFRTPAQTWRVENYLHEATEDDAAAVLSDLIVRQRCGMLDPRPPRDRRGGALREAWDRKRVLGHADRTLTGLAALMIGMPVRAAVLAANRVRRRARIAS